MSKRARLEMNRKGVDQYLKSSSVSGLTAKHGNRLAGTAESEAGDGSEFDVRTFTGRDRARTHVGTKNAKAMIAEAKNRTLTRAAYRMGSK